MERLFWKLAAMVAPQWAERRRFEAWLAAYNRMTLIELQGGKGSAEWAALNSKWSPDSRLYLGR